MISNFAAFVGISAIVIVTPGPDTALTIRNAVLGGRRGGLLTAAGVASGQATWAFFTAAGVAALLRASQPAFITLRFLGATYLIYLGLRALISAWRTRLSAPHEGNGYGRRVAPRVAYRQGLISNLGNPKMVVFFISLLPQFSAHGSFIALLLLGLAFCVMTLGWLAGYALIVARVGEFFRQGRVRRGHDAVTGVVLVALGVRLITEQR